jgi:type II restriction/modification system DNA methylase subunit YeeA
VRVSLVCFAKKYQRTATLNGEQVSSIHADLTGQGGSTDVTSARRLLQNRNIAFQGPVKVGPFDVQGDLARRWLKMPVNPNGKANGDVVRPLLNGMDITRRTSDRWIVDFGTANEADSAIYEAPFEHIFAAVKPLRDKNRRDRRRLFWWQHGETVPGIKRAIAGRTRAIFTPRVAKHRLFVWAGPAVVPDSAVVIIARDDDTTFGVLHSYFHEIWSLRMGTSLEDRPRYTPSTTFETFPFPEGLTPNIPAAEYSVDPRAQAIAAAAARLNDLRENWLNPADLVVRIPEVVPGYLDRILPRTDDAARELNRRTLTNLYNTRPQWLVNAHAALDEAVADAYGWGEDWRTGRPDDNEILERLFALNQARSVSRVN